MGSDSTLNPDNIDNNSCFKSQPEFLIFGASVQGFHHRKNNKPCEDAYIYRYTGDFLIIAVADGVSSTENGGKGAETAVRGAVNACAEIIEKGETKTDLLIYEGFSAGRRAIMDLADLSGIPLSSYATTLLLVCITGGKVFCGHIGDGTVVCANDEKIMILSEPARCEYANETTVLTSSDWERYVRISSGYCNTVILATDGCQSALIHSEQGRFSPYGPFILPLIRKLPDYIRSEADVNQALADLLLSEKMQALSSDDMTLVVALKFPCENE